MPVRFVTRTVLGREVRVRQTMDPEINDRVENGSVIGLSSEELDALRCAANGTTHVSIQRSEQLRKARPRKAAAKNRDIGEVLKDLVRGAIKNEGKDMVDDPIATGALLGSSDGVDAALDAIDGATAADNVDMLERGEAPPPPNWEGGASDDHEFDDKEREPDGFDDLS